MPDNNNNNKKIQLRPARWSDLSAVGHVAEQAFFEDNLLGDLLHPHRRTYPGDMSLYWTRRCRVHFWDYRWRQVVAVDHEHDDKVVGFIQWERLGEGGKALEPYWFDPRNAMKPLVATAMALSARLWPNRAADPDREDILERAYPFLLAAGCWTGDRAESWYLETLVVHPAYHGQGVGSRLVAAGLDQLVDLDAAPCDEARPAAAAGGGGGGCCASVISTKGKEAFYRDKCGFASEEGHIGMGEGNPMAGVDGGRMFWRDARKGI